MCIRDSPGTVGSHGIHDHGARQVGQIHPAAQDGNGQDGIATQADDLIQGALERVKTHVARRGRSGERCV